MKPFLEILTLASFAVAMVVAPVAWFRMVRAKTRSAYWKNTALFAGPILLVFLFANGAGLIPEAPPRPSAPPSPQDVLGKMPTSQVILLALVAAIWIGGGNLLFHFYNRRLGKKWWQARRESAVEVSLALPALCWPARCARRDERAARLAGADSSPFAQGA